MAHSAKNTGPRDLFNAPASKPGTTGLGKPSDGTTGRETPGSLGRLPAAGVSVPRQSGSPITRDAIEAEPRVFKLDRRRHERVPLEGSAVAVFHRPNARPLLTSVKFVDASPAGVGVVCTEPVKPGSTFTIYPEDASLPARIGVVVRCVEGQGGEWYLGLYSGARAKAA